MSTVFRLIVQSLALFLLVSCATVVKFDVEHPPQVDLRNVNTITVIPFEWISARRHDYSASRVTAALMNGLRWGSIDIVDPYALGNTSGRSYRQFADVYITGRIVNVSVYEQVDTISGGNHNVIRETVTVSSVVDIEYNYIRSADNKVLGNFKKRAANSAAFEHIRYQEPYINHNTGRNTPRNNMPRDTPRRGAGRGASRGVDTSRGISPQIRAWQQRVTESAISKFTDTMAQELGSWTTTERRKVKGKTGDDQLAAEAKNLIEQNRYNEALVLYKTIYEQNGNVSAGYNAAILFAANEQFADALGLLERLHNGMLKEGKKVPSFVKNEIKKMAGFINDYTKLEPRNGGEAKTVFVTTAAVPTTATAATTTAADGREIAGTVNLNPAMVYALNGSVSSIDDNSVFSKMVALAYADADNGRWSMQLPDAAPAEVWLLVTDGHREHYITKTALKFSGTITLDTAAMTKLN